MYYRLEWMSKSIDVGGSQGPVPAWDNHQQPQSKDSSLSLAPVMIYMGIKIHDNRQAEGVPSRYTEEKAVEGGREDWSNAARKTPAATTSWKRQRTVSPLGLPKGLWLWPHLDFWHPASRTVRILCGVRPPDLGWFVTATLQHLQSR